MSLLLVQGYDSDHDDRLHQDRQQALSPSDESEFEGEEEHAEPEYLPAEDEARGSEGPKGPLKAADQRSASGLPSANAAFQEVNGVPDFLLPSAFATQPLLSRHWGLLNATSSSTSDPRFGLSSPHIVAAPMAADGAPLVSTKEAKNRKGEEKGLSKAETQQKGAKNRKSGDATTGGQRKSVGAALPPKEAAASLLRICEICQVPKTFSNARSGMVCPLCGDREQGRKPGASKAEKKREGAVKDKEKMKRMKGQSSHAVWKSETEMQLRQTYD